MTPTPPDAQLLKTAVGSAEYVSCRYYPNTMQAIEELKLSGYTIWGVETTSESTIYCDQAYPQPLALVFGNEIIGIDTAVLRMCDSLICVPTYAALMICAGTAGVAYAWLHTPSGAIHVPFMKVTSVRTLVRPARSGGDASARRH
eukprot:6174237-Pleurochrysis_carterae.AAC.1